MDDVANMAKTLMEQPSGTPVVDGIPAATTLFKVGKRTKLSKLLIQVSVTTVGTPRWFMILAAENRPKVLKALIKSSEKPPHVERDERTSSISRF